VRDGLLCSESNGPIAGSPMEEDSPVPGKAMRERIQSKPTQERWDYVGELYVVADLCTGCGVCEHFCPVGAEPGIVVSSNNEDREAVAVV